MDSTSNNFYLTGVQLELGEQATPFEHEDVGTTLAKCQRYYQQWNVPSYSRLTLGYSDINTRVQAIIPLATPLRSLESVGHTNLTIEGVAVSAFGLTQINSQLTGSINIGSASLTVGNMEQVYAVGSGTFYASGEL